MTAVPFLEVRGVSKSYGGVSALTDVDVSFAEGECVALMGGNGAGKSTLVGIMSGVVSADRGELLVEGKPRRFATSADARSAGIETVFQDLGLCPNLSAASNLFLGRELARGAGPFRFVRMREMEEITHKALRDLGVHIPDLRAAVAGYSGGQRQGLAFARAVQAQARLLVLDEPTAALGVNETQRVRETVKRLLAERAIGVVLITHDLAEMRALAERVIVLYHGRVAGTMRCDEADDHEIVSMITGFHSGRQTGALA